MGVVVRPGRPEDGKAIARFGVDTFTWGDYVGSEYPRWLDRPGRVLVAADGETPVGVGRALLLSPREAWIHGLRVAPERRREGIGASLLAALTDWSREAGANVVRLLVEEENEPSHALVRGAGFVPVSPWISASTDVGPIEPVDPRANGGKRVPGDERLVPAPAAEAGPAWIAWSTSELARTGRQLLPLGWHLRRMTVADLEEAARRKAFWACPSGWLVADLDGDRELFVSWMATTDIDAGRLLRALLDWARAAGIERAQLLAPDVPWLAAALEHAGFSTSRSTVYAHPL